MSSTLWVVIYKCFLLSPAETIGPFVHFTLLQFPQPSLCEWIPGFWLVDICNINTLLFSDCSIIIGMAENFQKKLRHSVEQVWDGENVRDYHLVQLSIMYFVHYSNKTCVIWSWWFGGWRKRRGRRRGIWHWPDGGRRNYHSTFSSQTFLNYEHIFTNWCG